MSARLLRLNIGLIVITVRLFLSFQVSEDHPCAYEFEQSEDQECVKENLVQDALIYDIDSGGILGCQVKYQEESLPTPKEAHKYRLTWLHHCIGPIVNIHRTKLDQPVVQSKKVAVTQDGTELTICQCFEHLAIFPRLAVQTQLSVRQRPWPTYIFYHN